MVQAIDSPGQLADMVANLLDIKNEEKQDILETLELGARLDKVLGFLAKRVEVLRLSKEIGDKTRQQFDERQREHVLREQMRQIQKELGDDEDTRGRDRGPEEGHRRGGLARGRAQAGEEGVQAPRAHGRAVGRVLDAAHLARVDDGTALEVVRSQKEINIQEARAVLDEDHFGLEKIKRRILEYLAVRKLNPEGKSPILCFVGPPGVGKTSLGQSIARATDRKFQRIALGGTHDEAEIRGHRRTYIGALPGNIIQAVKRAGIARGRADAGRDRQARRGRLPRRPVLGAARSARSGAERQVPRQLPGRGLRPVARDVHRHREPARHHSRARLRDRMEIIQLPGYTEEEKLEIAKKYLVKRQLEANGLQAGQVELNEGDLAEPDRRLHARGGRAQPRTRRSARCCAARR